MKALKILNYIYSELIKNNTKGVWIEPTIIRVAILELENIENMTHLNCPTTTDTSSNDSYASLEKRIKHIENTLEKIFRASAYNKDALNKNNKHLNYTTTADTSSKECCLSLEKRIKHIENTLEEIFRASAYNKDALNKNKSVWHYFKSKQ